jgi:hypothetical protein
MGERNASHNLPHFRYTEKAINTFTSGTTQTITNAAVEATSIILIMHITQPQGRWSVAVSGGSFIITSSDSESNATFKYIII